MSLDYRIQSVIVNFQQQLSDLLEIDSIQKVQKQRFPESDDDLDQSRGGGLPSNLLSKISHISQLSQEVLSDLKHTTLHSSTPTEDYDESGPSQAPVTVLGPPGTEPRKGVSNGRFDKAESTVYSRSTSHISLPRQPLKLHAIPPKDTPRRPAEVYTQVKEEGDFSSRRWTRSGTRSVHTLRAARPEYAEESGSSSEMDSVSSELSPRELPQMDIPSTCQVRGTEQQILRDTLSQRIPTDPSTISSEYETASEYIVQVADTTGQTSSPATPLIVGKLQRYMGGGVSGGSSPLFLPKLPAPPKHSPSSGIHTVLKDLQNAFMSEKQKRLSNREKKMEPSRSKPQYRTSQLVHGQSVGERGDKVIVTTTTSRQAPLTRPFSVVVKKLPLRIYERHFSPRDSSPLSSLDDNISPASPMVDDMPCPSPASASSGMSESMLDTKSGKTASKSTEKPNDKKPLRLSGLAQKNVSRVPPWSSDSDFDSTPVVSGGLHGKSGGVEPGKLDKHTKSPKGKEKAASAIVLPDVIDCTACGHGIRWQKQAIHAHQRLDVLICEKCWMKYNTGNFTVEGGSEDYCTLCGDGGDMICCDTCEKSLCEKCISRVSGDQTLQRLLTEDITKWQCYSCDPRPIAKEKKLCKDLCDYYRQEARLAKKNRETKTALKRNSKGVNDGGTHGGNNSSVGTKNQTCTDGHNCGESDKEHDEGDTKERERKGITKGKLKLSLLGDSDIDLSSEGSLEVNTDEISMSDSDLFDDEFSFKRKRRRRKKEHMSKKPVVPNPEKNDERGARSSSPTSGNTSSSDIVKRTSKKMAIRMNQSPSPNSNSNSDFETQPPPSQGKTKKRILSGSSGEDGRITNSRKKERRSRFVSALSSGSDSEGGPLAQVEHNSGISADELSSTDRSPTTAPNLMKSVQYSTPKTRIDSSSSDSEISFLERRKKTKKRSRHVFGSDDSDKSRSGGTSEDDEKPLKKKKLKNKKESSSDDDFERDLSQCGPRLKRRHVKKSVLWSSDSDAEEESGSNKEEAKNGEEKSDGDENDSQQITPSRKRKSIRKVMRDASLTLETKAAQQREKDRIERLKQKAKKLKEEDKDTERLILEQDPESKEITVEVRRSLVRPMKPHQREGTKFLYEACVENLERFKAGECSGAILAHCMGLGKTLQVIGFIDALLSRDDSGISRVLILSPVNTIYNWRNEYELWLPYHDCDYNLYLLTDMGLMQRYRKLQRWFEGGGIMFAGYEMFRNLAQGKKMRKSKREAFKSFLLDPGPDMIVCDEGHVMRNAKSSLSLTLNQVKTQCRIVLTGTPLQNNLLEYYTMVNFVKPNLLGTQSEFKNRFANPIANGQCKDSTSVDVRLMKQRAHVLHDLLSGMAQRRDYRVLAECLPPKQEYVVSIRLSPVQDQLYRRYLDKSSGHHTASDLFSTFSSMMKVWNHPWVLKLDEIKKYERAEYLEAMYGRESSDGSLDGFIVSEGSDVAEIEERRRKGKGKNRSSSVVSSGPTSMASDSRPNTPVVNSIIVLDSDDDDEPSWKPIQFLPSEIKPQPDVIELPDSTTDPINNSLLRPPLLGEEPRSRSHTPSQGYWYQGILTDDLEGRIDLSGKLQFLLELLEHAERLKEKVLVFTQSLLTLDIIEEFLNKPEYGEWTPGLDYYRLDGAVKSDIRSAWMEEFNDKSNDRMRLFLISTRAGSLGVNLVAANRVVIFDACWNPSHDLQAVFRTYRFGQTKPIFVYRLLAQGTMEEKIYDRQVTKQSLSMRVVDEKQIGRHYTASDLAELFTYSPPPPPPPPPLPTYKRPEADLVLCTILDKLQPLWVTDYHEHDSLLEHVFDEELSEEERKAAWENYKAQMTAESTRYNYQALQSRIDENDMQGPSGIIASVSDTAIRDVNRDALAMVNTLHMAIGYVKQMQLLYQKKAHLSLQVQQRGSVVPPVLKQELAQTNDILSKYYSHVSTSIQQVNDLTVKCQSSQVTLHPSINQTVNTLRGTLLQQVEAFKRLSAPPRINQQFPQAQNTPFAAYP